MLELKNIRISLKKDGRQIVDDFSFTLKEGDKAVIIGEEGNGKSTLLKFIYDRSLVDAYCDCEGSIITKSKLAYLPQMLETKLYQTSLFEFFGDTEYYLYMDVLSRLGLSLDFILSDQKLGTLSGGEKVKVQLARLLMEEPDILLLDEPTNDLDVFALHWMESFISESRLPILFISHDETLIENTATVIIHMEQLARKPNAGFLLHDARIGSILLIERIPLPIRNRWRKSSGKSMTRQMEKWRRIYNRVEYEQRNISKAERDHVVRC